MAFAANDLIQSAYSIESVTLMQNGGPSVTVMQNGGTKSGNVNEVTPTERQRREYSPSLKEACRWSREWWTLSSSAGRSGTCSTFSRLAPAVCDPKKRFWYFWHLVYGHKFTVIGVLSRSRDCLVLLFSWNQRYFTQNTLHIETTWQTVSSYVLKIITNTMPFFASKWLLKFSRY